MYCLANSFSCALVIALDDGLNKLNIRIKIKDINNLLIDTWVTRFCDAPPNPPQQGLLVLAERWLLTLGMTEFRLAPLMQNIAHPTDLYRFYRILYP